MIVHPKKRDCTVYQSGTDICEDDHSDKETKLYNAIKDIYDKMKKPACKQTDLKLHSIYYEQYDVAYMQYVRIADTC